MGGRSFGRPVRGVAVVAAGLCLALSACTSSTDHGTTGAAAPRGHHNGPARVSSSPASRSLSGVVLAAAHRTQRAPAARMAMHLVVRSPHHVMWMSSTGAVDPRDRSAAMVLHFRLGGHPDMQLQERIVHLKLYMHSAQLEARMPGTKPWLVVDLRRLAEKQGVDLSQLSRLNGDPSNNLAALRDISSKVREVGAETVRGVPTTHYRAQIDLAKALTRRHLGQGLFGDFVRQELNRKTLPVDLWVGRHDGRVRQEVFRMSLKPPFGPRLHVYMRFQMYDFGADVNVVAPPPSQTENFFAALRRAAAHTPIGT